MYPLFIYLVIQINIIFSYKIITFDEYVTKINKKYNYTSQDYKNIISNITELLDYYIYLDIAKKPPENLNIEPVDLIKELNNINTNTNFYDFSQQILKIIFSVKDHHLSVEFDILYNFRYISPVKYFIKTENDTNYLCLKLNNEYENYINKDLIDKISKVENLKIIKINNYDEPFDYIQNFGMQLLKSKHAQFSYNLENINFGNFNEYPFSKSDLENIEIIFENDKKINFNFIIYDRSENIEKKESKKLFDIKKKEISNIKLEWDLNFENILKYKEDNKNKVNVIYQKNYQFKDQSYYYLYGEIMEKMNKNNYPIIVIQDLNNGGEGFYAYILAKILNFNLIKSKEIGSYKFNEKTKEFLKNDEIYNLNNCKTEKLEKYFNNPSIDNYGNNIIHKRTNFFYGFNLFGMHYYLRNYTRKNRKPTEILIYTDGYSFSSSSIFIKDIQEYGNGIIVGYNGNPSNKNKNDKFDSSQSPTAVIQIKNLNKKYYNNLRKYNINMNIPYYEMFNDNYQNNNIIHIPREYEITKIDERSSIYGKYNDERYEEFIKEGLKIINKYNNTDYCNKDNQKLLLINDKCKFENSYTFGGFICDKNGKWNYNQCKKSYCSEGYFFDNYQNKCLKDPCFVNIKLLIILGVSGGIILLVSIIVVIVYCRKKKKKIEDINNNTSEINLVMHEENKNI